jgi:hypothetical protein
MRPGSVIGRHLSETAMQISLTYTFIEWHALVKLLSRPEAPAMVEPDLAARINNTVGRSWLAGRREATIEVVAVDASVLRSLRAGLPDAEVLSAWAEAEQIVREHQRRHAPR